MRRSRLSPLLQLIWHRSQFTSATTSHHTCTCKKTPPPSKKQVSDESWWQHVVSTLSLKQACLSRSFNGAAFPLCVLKSRQSRHSSLSTINNLLPVSHCFRNDSASATVGREGELQQHNEPQKSEDLRLLQHHTCPENTEHQNSFQCSFNETDCRGVI